jgi:hypothetical protein
MVNYFAHKSINFSVESQLFSHLLIPSNFKNNKYERIIMNRPLKYGLFFIFGQSEF